MKFIKPNIYIARKICKRWMCATVCAGDNQKGFHRCGSRMYRTVRCFNCPCRCRTAKKGLKPNVSGMNIPGWGSVGFRGMRMSELLWSGIDCRGLHVDTVGKLPTTSLQEEETVRTSAVIRKEKYWREFIYNLSILSIFYPVLLLFFFPVSWPGWKIAFNLSSCPKLGNNLHRNVKYKSNRHQVQLFKIVLALFSVLKG